MTSAVVRTTRHSVRWLGGSVVTLGRHPRKLTWFCLVGRIDATVKEDDMRSTIATMFFAALLVGGSSVALAQDTQPVMLDKQRLMHQDEETRVLNLLSANGYTDMSRCSRPGTLTPRPPPRVASRCK
jgi:hypothetical protein